MRTAFTGWAGLVAAVCLLRPVLAAPGTWSQGTDLPAPAQTCASCVLDGFFYVMGGHDDKAGNHALTNVWAYAPRANSWTNRAPLPRGRHFLGQCAVAVDGVIYLIGGSGPGVPGTLIREVAAYNPKTDTWTNGAFMPTGRGNLAACAVDGIIYAIAGSAGPGSQLATVEAYDPRSNQWTTKRSMPQARWFVTASVVNGIIYVFHGTDVFAYDPKTDMWTTKASHFSPFSWGLMSAEVDGTIYLFGGFTQDWSDGHDFTLAYDPVQDRFSARRTMPRKRATAACGAIGGRIYFAGGTSEEPLANPDAVYYTTLDIFNPRTERYVDASGLSPAPPYTTWATAARVIQDAVNAAEPGDEVVVTNGIYATGGRAVGTNLLVNRVALDKPLTLRSVNGPRFTTIQGYQVPGITNGDDAVRCVYLAPGANLNGFTLTNGATRSGFDFVHPDGCGGGVFSEAFGQVSNCVLVGNAAASSGGGAYFCSLYRCQLIANSAVHLGGGADLSFLSNCVLTGNSALLGRGGGACSSDLNNCTVTGNLARTGGGASGSLWYSQFNNCIIYSNSAEEGPNHWCAILNNCCTTPEPSLGLGNITNGPVFVDDVSRDFRLASNSPCINAGHNAYVTTLTDQDGNPRIVSGTVDIGAYEYQGPGSIISYAWLQQYGLPTNGSADDSDVDGDGHNTWQEWRCQTDPTNLHSALRLLSAQRTGTHITVTWQSVAGVSYLVERSQYLTGTASGFTLLATNIPGLPQATAFTDTNAATPAQLFYRVGVQQ